MSSHIQVVAAHFLIFVRFFFFEKERKKGKGKGKECDRRDMREYGIKREKLHDYTVVVVFETMNTHCDVRENRSLATRLLLINTSVQIAVNNIMIHPARFDDLKGIISHAP